MDQADNLRDCRREFGSGLDECGGWKAVTQVTFKNFRIISNEDCANSPVGRADQHPADV